jgi:hypothetical protein
MMSDQGAAWRSSSIRPERSNDHFFEGIQSMVSRRMTKLLAPLFAAGVTGPGAAALADPPTFLYTICVGEERESLRAARNECDDHATGLGYKVGIFRPLNPTDVLKACFKEDPENPITVPIQYICDGVQ